MFRAAGLLAALAIVASCAPAPERQPSIDATVGPGSPTAASASAATTPGPSPSVALPTWSWTEARIDIGDNAGPVTAIWGLPSGLVAVATRYRDDDLRLVTFLVSTDGLAWKQVGFPEQPFYYETGLVEDGTLTIVGSTGPAKEPNRRLWQTRDGRSWTRIKGVRGLDFGPGWVESLVHADAGWLALGVEVINPEAQRAHLLFSTDALAWTEREYPGGASTGGLASDGRRFAMLSGSIGDVAHGVDVLLSDDGRVWSSVHVADLPKYDSASVIAATPDGIAIGGQRFDPQDESSHPIGWWSEDGLAWAPSTVDGLSGPAGEAGMFDMAASDGGLLASGNGDPLSSAVWVSDAGLRWTQVTPLPPGLRQFDGSARIGENLVVAGWISSETPTGIWFGSRGP